MDGMAEAGSNSSLHTTPEQSVAAQSQHHQQFIGEQTAFMHLMSHIWADNLKRKEGPVQQTLTALDFFFSKKSIF